MRPASSTANSPIEITHRRAWPLATVSYGTTAVPFLPPYPEPLFLVEPMATLAAANVLATLVQIDKWVLVPRNAWFNSNSFRLPLTASTARGVSLGEKGPRAVIAEEGLYGVSTHEIGHTYRLSRRKCSNGAYSGDRDRQFRGS
jgi:hypothetical protein